jgi:hypothetical protein
MTNKRVLAAVGGIGATAVLGLGLWLGNGVMSTSQVGLVSHSDRGPAPSKAPDLPKPSKMPEHQAPTKEADLPQPSKAPNQPAAPEQPRS